MRVHVVAAVLAFGVAGVAAQSAGDSAAALAVVDGFHAAVAGGNPAAALQLLAEDAILLEAGGVETRAEYAKNHLPADMEFEKGV